MFPRPCNKIMVNLEMKKEKRILQLHTFFQRLFYQNYLDIFTLKQWNLKYVIWTTLIVLVPKEDNMLTKFFQKPMSEEP